MTSSLARPSSGVSILRREVGGLARGLPPAPPGTLFVLGDGDGISIEPDAGFDLVFGRYNQPHAHAHVGVGEDDDRVSRHHGRIVREHSRWVLYNDGVLPIRFPDSQLVIGGQWRTLEVAYTPLFIVAAAAPRREHLLEVRIAAGTPSTPGGDRRHVKTRTPDAVRWPLDPLEHLVIVCLSQRYLRGEPHAQPLPWAQVVFELSDLPLAEQWGERRAQWLVKNVRHRLSKEGVSGLLEEEVPSPVGNALNHNLIMELLRTTTIVKSDLRLLGE